MSQSTHLHKAPCRFLKTKNSPSENWEFSFWFWGFHFSKDIKNPFGEALPIQHTLQRGIFMSYYFKPVRNTSLTSKHLQCPIRAFSNFYPSVYELVKCAYGCQCPIRAFFNFYRMDTEEYEAAVVCQCPIRAFFNFYTCTRILSS